MSAGSYATKNDKIISEESNKTKKTTKVATKSIPKQTKMKTNNEKEDMKFRKIQQVR